jgi:hypothetical protein
MNDIEVLHAITAIYERMGKLQDKIENEGIEIIVAKARLEVCKAMTEVGTIALKLDRPGALNADPCLECETGKIDKEQNQFSCLNLCDKKFKYDQAELKKQLKLRLVKK